MSIPELHSFKRLKCLFSFLSTFVTIFFLVFQYREIPKTWHCVDASSTVTYLTVEAIPLTGLGNAMTQYASLLGTAIKSNKTPVFIPSAYYPSKYIYPIYKWLFTFYPLTTHIAVECPASLSSYFDTTIKNVDFCFTNWKKIELPSSIYDPNIHKIFAPDQSYVMTGYFEALGYFSNIRTQLIEKEFRFKPAIHLSGILRLNEVRKHHCSTGKPCLIIGLHVRRREKARPNYNGDPDCRFISADSVYIQNAIRFYENRFERNNTVVFAVLGDDIDWNRKHVPLLTRNAVTIVKAKTAPEDMRFLSLCDHLIINIGTYGFWAGYLSKGLVVYPEHYGNVQYYLPEWIKVPRRANNSTRSCLSELKL